MRSKDIERTFAAMSGDQLMEDLLIYAASWLDMHQEDEDNVEAFAVRRICFRHHQGFNGLERGAVVGLGLDGFDVHGLPR